MAKQKELREAFGSTIRKYRRRKDWSQMELAQEAGLHLNAVHSIERGKRSPTLHTVFVLARALDVPASRLVGDTEEWEPRF